MRYLLIILLLSGCKISKEVHSNYTSDLEAYRDSYKTKFIETSHSPLSKEDIANLDFYDANEDYNCNCTFKLLEGQKPIDVNTSADKTKKYLRHGIVSCRIQKEIISLTVFKSLRLMAMPEYKDNLFLPFMDLTNGDTTYGGGRYIDLNKTDIDENNNLSIDFNKCYNPYCAYSDGYSCPIPPLENHLNIVIPVGEKKYKGKKKKKK